MVINFKERLIMFAIVILLICIIAIITFHMSTCFSIPFVCSTDTRYINRKYIGQDGTAFCITSGGCNPLDECMYRDKVYTCDVINAQNYLLELKIATVKSLPYDIFWNMFGKGVSKTFRSDYRSKLRPQLSEQAKRFWDVRQYYFEKGLYTVGSAPVYASTWLCKTFWPQGHRSFVNKNCLSPNDQLNLVLQPSIQQLLKMYGLIHRVSRSYTMSGVVHQQWKHDNPTHVLRQGLIRRASVPKSFCIDYISRLYVTGSFSQECCPSYMRPENYHTLHQCVNRIFILQGNFVDALRQVHRVSEIFPLDHMDCLSLNEVRDEAIEMNRVTSHHPPHTPIAVVKCVSATPAYIHILQEFFHVIDVSDDLPYDGSDIYMVQKAFLLLTT